MNFKCMVTLALFSFCSLSFAVEQRKLNDSLETELKSILTLSSYFKLSLASRFLECEVYNTCPTQAEQTNIGTRPLLYQHNNLTMKERALNFLYLRMLTLDNVNHDHIVWYINGLSKLRDIDQRVEKLTPKTFEYLQKFTYVAYDKITRHYSNPEQFKYFKYSKDGEAIFFYYKASEVANLEKMVAGFTVQNDPQSLKYVDLRGIGYQVDPTTQFNVKENITEKFKTYTSTIAISGKMNKIVVRPNALNNSNFIISGHNNSIVASDHQLINGDNNLIINSSNIEMYGNENTIMQINRIKQKTNNHIIRGSENIIADTTFDSITGNQNFIQKQNLVNFAKNNQMKMRGQMFWKANDHQSEKVIFEEVDKILNIPYIKSLLQ